MSDISGHLPESKEQAYNTHFEEEGMEMHIEFELQLENLKEEHVEFPLLLLSKGYVTIHY